MILTHHPKYHVDLPAPFRLSHSCVTSHVPALENTLILLPVRKAEGGPMVDDAPHP